VSTKQVIETSSDITSMINARAIPRSENATRPIRVLFLGFPLTHYFRDLFNRLHQVPGISVLHVQHAGKHKHAGEAVYQTLEGVEFLCFQLEEVVCPAKRVFGLSDFELQPAYHNFPGLARLFWEHRPHIVVADVEYHRIFTYNRDVRRAVREFRCKVVFRSIPFSLPTYEESLAAVPLIPRIPLRSSRFLRFWFRVSGLDRAYARWVRNPALIRKKMRERAVFCTPDAHIVYHEQGVAIYGSWGVPPERVHVVRNSPDTDKLLAARRRILNGPRTPTLQPHRIVHVGRLVQWKRVDLLIRAVAALRGGRIPDAELVVVGHGPCAGELQALAEQLGVAQSVSFRGGVYDEDELARCFLSSAVYVLAGMGGLSINEAMCFGLPVICSRCDGTEKFLVRDGVNGLYFRENDLSDLVEKIARLLEDSGLRMRMGAESLRIVKEEMNIHTLVSNYLHVFHALGFTALGESSCS